MIIKLVKLKLQNFRKHKDLTIKFGEHVTYLSGANEVGKSTIKEAINYTLFNKLSDGSKVDKIRPHDENGVDIDNIDIVTELDIEVDGRIINIKKTQVQNWSGVRGREEKQFDGNSNKYLVDSIPMSETEFKKFFAEIIEEQTFKSTTNTSFFFKENTSGRRKILFDLIPELTNDDIIDLNPKFEPLRDTLKTKTIDGLVNSCKFALHGSGKTDKGLKGEQEDIPKIINALNKSKVVIDIAELELQKNALKEQIEGIDKQLSDTNESVKAVDKLSNEIMQTQFSISDVKRKANEELFANRKEIQQQIDDIETKQSQTARKRSSVKSEIESLEDKISKNEKVIADCTVDLNVEKAKVFDESVWVFDESQYVLNENDTICPTCGRKLESDSIEKKLSDLEERKEKAKAELNQHKVFAMTQFVADNKKAIESIKTKGNNAYLTIKTDKETLVKLQSEFEEIKATVIDSNARRNALETQINALPSEVDLTDNSEIKTLEEKLTSLNATYESMKDSGNIRKDLESKKSDLQNEISEVQKKIDSADNSKIESEIAEYKTRQEELGKVIIPQIEKEQLFYEDFQLAKMKLLTDEINQHFSKVKFVLFEPNISGDGYKDICEPTYKGSYYSKGASDGNTIEMEIDILRTFQKLQNISVPIIIDRAESIDRDRIPKTESQLIVMRRTDDSDLKVEVE